MFLVGVKVKVRFSAAPFVICKSYFPTDSAMPDSLYEVCLQGIMVVVRNLTHAPSLEDVVREINYNDSLRASLIEVIGDSIP